MRLKIVDDLLGPAMTAKAALRKLAVVWTLLVVPITLVAMAWDFRPEGTPEHVFFWTQDLPVLAGATALLWLLSFVGLPGPPAAASLALSRRGVVFAAALAVLLTAGVGGPLVFEHFTMSLDETMANFDATIFSNGDLMAPIPAVWRPFSLALQPIYMLKGEGVWASSYLPLNAAMRALGQTLHLRDWVNPMFSAVALIATYGAGRRLWPEHPRRAVGAAVLMATSAQLLVMGMSAYAMPVHLAFNMVWLWLFLRDRRWSDVLALIIGFAAAGLHQLLFHPLFASLFILELMLARRWSRAGFFIVGYAAICLFWVSYFQLAFKIVGAAPEHADAINFADRVAGELAKLKPGNIGVFIENILRFVAWQNPVVPPLALLGAISVIRKPGPLRALAAGMAATGVMMLIFVSSQTHGWGYRYFHGYLGGVCLLAVQGWTVLSANLAPAERRRGAGAVAAVSALSLVFLIPLRIAQAHHFTHPYAHAFQTLMASGANIVLVDNGPVGFDANTLVQNDPFLRQTPKVMFMGKLTLPQIDQVCAMGKVLVFDANNPTAAGILTYPDAHWAKINAPLRERLRATGCAP